MTICDSEVGESFVFRQFFQPLIRQARECKIEMSECLEFLQPAAGHVAGRRAVDDDAEGCAAAAEAGSAAGAGCAAGPW